MADERLHALLVPYPTEGHIHGLLGLAQAMAERGFLITFAYPARAHAVLQQRNQAILLHPTIALHILPDGLATDLCRLPNIHDMKMAFPIMQNAVKLLAQKLSTGTSPISCIVSDSFVPWTQDLADELALPRVEFWTSTATVYSMGFHLPELITQGHLPVKNKRWTIQGPPVDFICGLPPFLITELPNEFLEEDLTNDKFQFMIRGFSRAREAHTVLVNSLYELESEAFDGLQAKQIPIYAVGPLFPPLAPKMDASTGAALPLPTYRQCLQWLDQQAVSSVVYVSLGSFAKFSLEEMHEMALGLEASGYPFLWVIRVDAIKGDLADSLPEGFLSRTVERRLIMSWAPQLQVLKHPSIGVFLSHCGWNSTLESLRGGKAMIACPRESEQRSNARQIVDRWRVGVELKRKEDGSFTKKSVEEALKAVMQQPEFRQRALELKQVVCESPMQDGISDRSFMEFLHRVSRSSNDRRRRQEEEVFNSSSLYSLPLE